MFVPIWHSAVMTLKDWLEREGKSDAWLAAEVGVSRPFITRIRTGARQPSLPVALKLSKITSLPASTFMKAA